MNKKNYVFYISIMITAIIALVGIISPNNFQNMSIFLYDNLINTFGPVYLILMLIIFVFCIFLGFGKYGDIKLGKDDDEPEYSNIVWFSMLFGAGMGIGLVFFGVYEPLYHFVNPIEAIPGSEASINFAIQQSFIHWGFHPWSGYCIIGLCLAYFQFRKDKPCLISSTLDPILTNIKRKEEIGLVVNIFSVVTTVIGVAASFGLGTTQIAAGLEHLFGITNTLFFQIIIVFFIAIIYITTAVSGIDKGINRLSNINLVLAIGLLISTFIIGPTSKIIYGFVNGVGNYINEFISQSLCISVVGNNDWINQWRVFYWAFWLSWTPFVGVFIARISKGRTVREFVSGVIILPSIVCLIWFSVFAMLGIDLGVEFAQDAIVITETSLFKVLSQYNGGYILSIISIVLVITFFITSANSAIYVLGMFTSNGELNPKNKNKIMWGIIQTLLAIVFIICGGLNTLQKIAIVISLPFAIIIVFMMISILKAFKQEIK